MRRSERYFLIFCRSICLPRSFLLTQCCVLPWETKILMRAIFMRAAGPRFPTPAVAHFTINTKQFYSDADSAKAFMSMSLCQVVTVCVDSLWPFCCAELDACSVHPCQNGGMCLPVDSSYFCSCAQGYTGVDCDSSKLTCWYIVSGGRLFHFVYEYKFLTSLSILQWKKCSAKKSSW